MKHVSVFLAVVMITFLSACTLQGAPPAPPTKVPPAIVATPGSDYSSPSRTFEWEESVGMHYLSEVQSTPDFNLNFRAAFFEGAKLTKAEMSLLSDEALYKGGRATTGVEFIFPVYRNQGRFQVEDDRSLVWINSDGAVQATQVYLPLDTWIDANFVVEGVRGAYWQRFVLTQENTGTIIMLQPEPAE